MGYSMSRSKTWNTLSGVVVGDQYESTSWTGDRGFCHSALVQSINFSLIKQYLARDLSTALILNALDSNCEAIDI